MDVEVDDFVIQAVGVLITRSSGATRLTYDVVDEEKLFDWFAGGETVTLRLLDVTAAAESFSHLCSAVSSGKRPTKEVMDNARRWARALSYLPLRSS